jgi:hypothetical protein
LEETKTCAVRDGQCARLQDREYSGPHRRLKRQLITRFLAPSCPRKMRIVGRERSPEVRADLLTFQCDCGQIFTPTTQ